ncbi:MAG TPA: hypothetical protein PKC69_09135, partial [Chitinophagaceae bacterium]|nr:hypothetical protein [Chitinophagaceae bacterium]
LDHIKVLKKDRNRLLYLLEMGKVLHLQGLWDSSNTYLNEADLLMEDAKTSVKDIALGNLLNPMMQTYKAEDFEKYLVHYYKALNYLQLGEANEALVEARRISLRTYAQEDKTGSRNKYSEDAFSYMLQGLIYEKANDINNAFIAYRNAADVYLNNKGSYYGTAMPGQLKKDLLRSAYQNGFTDELRRYEKLLQVSYSAAPRPEGGELILFWENGAAPVKEQQDLWFSLFKDAGGQFFFTDAAGLYNVPFDFSSGYDRNNIRLQDLRSFRVALPRYQEQLPAYSTASVQVNGTAFRLEAAENVNTLAFSTLRERMLKELSGTLTRLAVKKLAEAAVRPSGKKEDDSKKTEEERKKEKKQENTREAIALGLQLFNFASEKADTRNWQSLPHTIFYTRIPLIKGTNKINLQLEGQQRKTIALTIEGNGTLQFRNESTF